MIITRNFKYSEFVVSKDHPELLKDIYLTDLDKLKIYYLCATILQPIRDRYGPVAIESGKRSIALNNAVDGSTHSDHLYEQLGCAVDFTGAFNLAACAQTLQTDFTNAFGQVIYYPDRRIIHVSLPTPKHHGEFSVVRG